MNILLVAFIAALAYGIGCFPTGLIVGRLHGIDVTAEGSGNVGATNLARVAGRKAGVFTLAGDVLKGALAVGLARLISSEPTTWGIAALAAVGGHCYPPTLEIGGIALKGGKGVATALGCVTVIDWALGAAAVGSFALTFALFKIVSVSSLVAASVVPLVAFFRGMPDGLSAALCGVSLLILVRHRPNLERLARGEEPRFRTRAHG